MKDFFLALSFLTIIPIRIEAHEDIHRSFRFFPLVGALIGIIAYIFFAFLSSFLPLTLSSVFSIFLYHLINGGLHLDGFADLFDAYFGSKKNKDRFKEILKDSRIGVMGVFGLIFYFSTIFFAIQNIKLDLSFFVTLGLSGRLVIVLMTYLSKPLFDEGLGKYFIEKLTLNEVIISIFTSLIVVLFLGKLYVIFLMTTLLWGYLFKVYCNNYLGGVSGDILGAGCILTEILFVVFWRAFL